MSKIEYTYSKQLNADTLNDINVKKADKDLLPLLKDLDGNIKYLKVLSQEDFGKIKPDNDTVYLINNINEDKTELPNILDVAVCHTSLTNDEPEEIWMLTGDPEVEEVCLYKSPLDKGQFTLVRTYPGFVDGRLTFDGIYDYNEDYSQVNLITKGEPFLALINASGELYGFPTLNYKVELENNITRYGAYIDGGAEAKVQVCSVEKGYGSEFLKDKDQGIIIAYSKYDGIRYGVYYIQYGYIEGSNTKNFTLPTLINSTIHDDVIFNVAIRRFSDYRVGITYNYWDIDNNGHRISKTEFIYSERMYSGIAYRPDCIALQGMNRIQTTIYGAVRNDDIGKIDVPYVVFNKDPQINVYEDENAETNENGLIEGHVNFVGEQDKTSTTDFIFNFRASEHEMTPVKLELIDVYHPRGFSGDYAGNTLVDWERLLNIKIVNDFPYDNYLLGNDPSFGNAAAKAEVVKASVNEDQLILTLRGENKPVTPFKIIPSSERPNMCIRYLANSFNDKDGIRNASGWYAFTGVIGTEFTGFNSVGVTPNPNPHRLKDYHKSFFNNRRFHMFNATEIISNSGFHISGFNYNVNFVSETCLPSVEEINNVSFSFSFGIRNATFDFIGMGVTTIDV